MSNRGAKPKAYPRFFFPGALCASLAVPIETFFNPELAGDARKICRRCPEKSACAAYATRTSQVGVWGGTDDEERRRARNAGNVRRSRERRKAETAS